MHHLCNRVRYGHTRSSKVVDFGGNQKSIWNFLLVINSNLGDLVPFLKYGDLLVENRNFPYLSPVYHPWSG